MVDSVLRTEPMGGAEGTVGLRRRAQLEKSWRRPGAACTVGREAVCLTPTCTCAHKLWTQNRTQARTFLDVD